MSESTERRLKFRLPLGLLDRLPPALLVLLHDRYVWAMVIVALLVNLGLFAFLMIQFSQLPPLVPLHFDPAGEPDRIEPSNSIFSIPQIGLIAIALNLALGGVAYRREPLATYLLIGTAILVQFLLWFAAIAIVRAVTL